MPKDKFNPTQMTPEQLDTLAVDLKTHLFSNWDNIGGITKFFIRDMMKKAMTSREGGGGIPEEKLKKPNPTDFTPEEQDSLQVGLKDHILNEWDDFTFITKRKIKGLAKKATAEGQAKRAETENR